MLSFGIPTMSWAWILRLAVQTNREFSPKFTLVAKFCEFFVIQAHDRCTFPITVHLCRRFHVIFFQRRRHCVVELWIRLASMLVRDKQIMVPCLKIYFIFVHRSIKGREYATLFAANSAPVEVPKMKPINITIWRVVSMERSREARLIPLHIKL